MTTSPLNFDEFQTVTKSDWLKGANAQLKVENADQELSWKVIDGFDLPPYFDQSTSGDWGYLIDFFGQQEFEWQLSKRIVVGDIIKANAQALTALNEGCTGLLFELPSDVDLDRLTQGIHFNHCYVSFVTSVSFSEAVVKFMNINQIQGHCIKHDSSLCLNGEESINGLSNLLEAYANDIESKHLTVQVSKNFFFEIARLRACRYLMDRIDGLLGREKNGLWIHAEIERDLDEDKNLLVQTSAGLSAVIGGANSISFNSPSGQERIATNIGNLIREEAKITKFTDASSGSYFIDSLTDQMIQKVWSDFQTKMS